MDDIERRVELTKTDNNGNFRCPLDCLKLSFPGFTQYAGFPKLATSSTFSKQWLKMKQLQRQIPSSSTNLRLKSIVTRIV